MTRRLIRGLLRRTLKRSHPDPHHIHGGRLRRVVAAVMAASVPKNASGNNASVR